MRVVEIDKNLCTLCGICEQICVRGIIALGQDSAEITDDSVCIQCGHCRAVCPVDAPLLPLLDHTEFTPVAENDDLPTTEQFMNLIRSRRSIRQYKKTPIEKEKIDKIIEAGRFAPTGGNLQPLHHIVVTTPDVIDTVRNMTIDLLEAQAELIAEAYRKHSEEGIPLPAAFVGRDRYIHVWREMARLNREGIDRLFYKAPCLVITHLNPLEAVTPDVDPGLAASQMTLMAETLGLGTCFIGFLIFALAVSKQLREILQIPEGHRTPLSFVAGYPDVDFLKVVSRNPARVTWL